MIKCTYPTRRRHRPGPIADLQLHVKDQTSGWTVALVGPGVSGYALVKLVTVLRVGVDAWCFSFTRECGYSIFLTDIVWNIC